MLGVDVVEGLCWCIVVVDDDGDIGDLEDESEYVYGRAFVVFDSVCDGGRDSDAFY